MKITLLISLCLLFATAAFGQVGSAISSQPQILELPSHPQHASQQLPAREQSLFERSSVTWAQGERPLWEVAPAIKVVPLGDIARMLKKEHATAKKAQIIWEN
ncbi:MAG TPA: hypothetical protein VLW84_11880 [Terriglobales bacterium]|nr:hypothetical protein [Terriglobales bacterium]